MRTSQEPKAGRFELMFVKREPFLSRGPPPMGTNVAGQTASAPPVAPIPIGEAFPLLMTYPGSLPQMAKASTVAANVEVLFSCTRHEYAVGLAVSTGHDKFMFTSTEPE